MQHLPSGHLFSPRRCGAEPRAGHRSWLSASEQRSSQKRDPAGLLPLLCPGSGRAHRENPGWGAQVAPALLCCSSAPLCRQLSLRCQLSAGGPCRALWGLCVPWGCSQLRASCARGDSGSWPPKAPPVPAPRSPPQTLSCTQGALQVVFSHPKKQNEVIINFIVLPQQKNQMENAAW